MTVSLTNLRLITGASSVDASDDLMNLFGGMAQTVVDANLSGKGLDAAVTDAIALYLAAHFYVLSLEGGGITYTRAGQSEERYKTFGGDSGGFGTTRFGVTACAMDTTGILVAMSAKDKVPFEFESYSALKMGRGS